MSAVEVFWKHCMEKEKLLMASIFLLFYLFGELLAILIKFETVVWKLLSLQF